MKYSFFIFIVTSLYAFKGSRFNVDGILYNRFNPDPLDQNPEPLNPEPQNP
jgi:hypothetical protein